MMTLQTGRLAVAALCVAALAPRAAQAHFVWATFEGGQVRFALLENPSQAPDPRFGKYVEGLKTTLELGPVHSGARYCSVPTGCKVVLADSIVGARKRSGEPEAYLLVYHAKAAMEMADAATPTPGAPAELLARRDGKNLLVTALLGGKPAGNCALSLHLPGAEDSLSATTDAAGVASFELPASLTSGVIGVRARLVEAKRGEHEGQKYALIHHWATLTAPVSPTQRPLSILAKALDTDGDATLSAREIATAATALKTLDRNGDGKIDNAELHPPRLRPKSQAELYFEFDENKDGRLTRDELPERLHGIFGRVTLESDGSISQATLTRYVEERDQAEEAREAARRPSAPVSKPTIEKHGKDTYVVLNAQSGPVRRLARLMTAIDTDGDLQISAEEIAAAARSVLTLDENGDGKLDESEFAAVTTTEFITIAALEQVRAATQGLK